MDAWPSLSKAPIVEGLIDIRVAPLPAAALDSLKACSDVLAAEFPAREDLRQLTGQVTLSPAGATIQSADAPRGFLLRSADRTWAAQYRLDGFTISRLEPYTSWADLKCRAVELWSNYRDAAMPTKIVRVATRFINRIPLPSDEPFDRVFRTTFQISSSLPQSVAGYLLRIVVPFEQEAAMAIITQALEVNKQACVLDLDAFSEKQEGIPADKIWDALDDLRGIKNRLFFESLTPCALERFK
jgi:uncharacterized protein (TIGR04255 family)